MTKKYLIACAATLVLAFGGTALAGGEQGGEHAEGTQIEQQSGQEQEQAGQQGQQEPGMEGEQAGQQQGATGQQEQQAGMEGQQQGYDQLSLEQKKQLQRELQEQGFYQGNIDGIVGPQTRAAVSQFQQQFELAGNGQLTQETMDELGLNLQQPVAGGEQEQQQMGQQDPSQQQLQPGAAEAPQKFQLSALNEEQTRELQQKLQQHGFYQGNIDGIVGPQTRSALQAYFRDQANLASQGVVTESALNDFGINPSEVQPVRGTESEGSDWQQQQPQQQPQEQQQQQPPEQQPQQQPQEEGTPDVDIDVNNPDMGAEPQPAPEGTDEY